jgi:hypothetical protein
MDGNNDIHIYFRPAPAFVLHVSRVETCILLLGKELKELLSRLCCCYY